LDLQGATVHPYDLIFSGLSFDIVGALVLAKGFMLKAPHSAYYESLMIYGGNKHLLKSALEQRAEAQVGAGLLVLGFFLQMWGNLHGGISANEPGWIDSTPRLLIVVAVSCVFGGLLLYCNVRAARARFYRMFFHNYAKDTKLTIEPGDPTKMERMGELLGIARKRGETDEQFLGRIQDRYTVLGQRYGSQTRNLFVGDE